MHRHFHEELGAIRQTLLTMASHATAAVTSAMRALTTRDDELARRVQSDDEILDAFEKQVDEISIGLLALQAPLASDLRLITTAMKISHDLERVGDEATTIARRAAELNREPELTPSVDLPRMASLSLAMLNEAITSFIHRDAEGAREIIPRDKEVDRLNKQVHREFIGRILENPAAINRCLNMMAISKALERIGDHAANIAEEIVYACDGRDIRHEKPR
jgi:phosphate transport system protein